MRLYARFRLVRLTRPMSAWASSAGVHMYMLHSDLLLSLAAVAVKSFN
jgi:hypothetical protein